MNQPSQVRDSASNVLFYVESVWHSIPNCRRGHELHKADRALPRNRIRVPAGLHLDDCLHKFYRNLEGRRVGCRVSFGEFVHACWLRSPNCRCTEPDQENKRLHDRVHRFNPQTSAQATAPFPLSLSLYIFESTMRPSKPSRSRSLPRSPSVFANNGKRTSLCSGMISLTPRICSACARSSISAIEGGFSMFQPRSACAKPAI